MYYMKYNIVIKVINIIIDGKIYDGNVFSLILTLSLPDTRIAGDGNKSI